MRIAFLELAEKELEEAYDYYQSQQQGLGDVFFEELEQTLERIELLPNAWKPLGKHTRRCKMNAFPYAVIYQLRNHDEILIVAIAHSRKKLHYWQDRIHKL